MSNEWDDDLHRALSHPVRRQIIEYLQKQKALYFHELLQCATTLNHGKLGFHLRALKGLIEREPSTNKYRLTDKGKLAAEVICTVRLTMAKDELTLTHEPTTYVRRLELGDHAVLFYDTEEIKRKISFPFIEAGILKGEAVVYLTSEHKLDSEKQEIQKYGINLDNINKETLTIMSAEEWYMKKGKAQAKTIMDNWLTLVKEKQKAGFAGLRVAGEMEVFFNYTKTKELLRYETTLGRQLPPSACALCLYKTSKLDEQQFIQLNHSHGHSIFKGIAFKTM